MDLSRMRLRTEAAAMKLTRENLKTAKRALVASVPGAKSSYLTEALAAAFGYRTHAALLGDLILDDPPDVRFDEVLFRRRLEELEGRRRT